MSEGYGIFMG